MIYKTIERIGEIIYTSMSSSRKWYRMMLLMLMLYLIWCIYWNTCSSSVSNIYSLTTNTGSFNGISSSQIYQVVEGPVSLNLYFSYYFSSDTVIRRIGTDGTLKWMAAIIFGSYGKRMVVDSTEQNLYVWDVGSPLHVVKLQTSDGTIVDARTL